jgi:putative transposase
VVEHTMDVSTWLRKQLEEADLDLLRVMVKDFAEALMSADADAVCGARLWRALAGAGQPP